MKKVLFLSILLLLFHTSQGQRKRFQVAFTPAINKTINGIGLGLAMNATSKHIGSSKINGLSIELLGVGLALPLAPSSPIYKESKDFYLDKDNLASAIGAYDKFVFEINGLSLSPGGIAGHDINVNGVNLSGLNTLTGKMNGVSLCIMFNLSGVVNGISIGAFNETMKTHGLQIGLITHTSQLRGFQIGLWNVNQKRKLPFINWCFD